jgi:hypothetical protein
MTRPRSLSTVILLAAGTMGLTAAGASAEESPNYGTANLTWVQVAGATFTPLVSSYGYTTTVGPVLRIATGTGGAQVYFAAPIQIPSGALIRFLELDACDSTGVPGYVQGTLVGTDRLGNIIHSVPYTFSTGAGCSTVVTDLTALNIVADNHTKHFFLQAIIGVATDVGLAGMTVGYQLQVSPAPAVATFLDVPTGHQFFQFVEAFAAAGITGGCGSGNYCPDSPVTRGQMATFLAKALGLQFP